MGFLMKPKSALLRLVENEAAPIMARVRALEAVQNPPLAVLQRLLWIPTKVPRKKPVPAKLLAVAAFKYKQEMELKDRRKQLKKPLRNTLGI